MKLGAFRNTVALQNWVCVGFAFRSSFKLIWGQKSIEIILADDTVLSVLWMCSISAFAAL